MKFALSDSEDTLLERDLRFRFCRSPQDWTDRALAAVTHEHERAVIRRRLGQHAGAEAITERCIRALAYLRRRLRRQYR